MSSLADRKHVGACVLMLTTPLCDLRNEMVSVGVVSAMLKFQGAGTNSASHVLTCTSLRHQLEGLQTCPKPDCGFAMQMESDPSIDKVTSL